MSGAPDANTVRDYLTEQLPPPAIPELEQQCNSLLRTLIPDLLRTRPQDLAVDFQDEPYYGHQQPDDRDSWVCRGQAREGTTRFYRCATAYIILQDVRLTVAVVFVKRVSTRSQSWGQLLNAVKATFSLALHPFKPEPVRNSVS